MGEAEVEKESLAVSQGRLHLLSLWGEGSLSLGWCSECELVCESLWNLWRQLWWVCSLQHWRGGRGSKSLGVGCRSPSQGGTDGPSSHVSSHEILLPQLHS